MTVFAPVGAGERREGPYSDFTALLSLRIVLMNKTLLRGVFSIGSKSARPAFNCRDFRVVLGCTFALLFGSIDAATPQTGGVPDLELRVEQMEQRLAALEALTAGQNPQIATLQAKVISQQSQITALLASVASQAAAIVALEGKTRDMTRLVDANTGINTVRFTGVNLQVVDGSGVTAVAVGSRPLNGAGNVIVGYNHRKGSPAIDTRTGSHNLIVGDLNNYSNEGGLIAGIFNTISGQYASVLGGNVNTASGVACAVSGGRFNTASFEYSSVTGGVGNSASSFGATVSGGFERNATGFYDWVAGGLFQEF